MLIIDLTKIKAVFFDRGNVVNDCRFGPPEKRQDEEAAGLIWKSLKMKGIDVSFQAVFYDFICKWKDSFAQRDNRGYEIPVSNLFNEFTVRHQLSDYVVSSLAEMKERIAI